MGFFYLALKIPQIITITIITNVTSYIISLILSALSRIGLFKSHDPDDDTPGGASIGYVLILDGTSPSLQPVPIHVVTAAIKDKVNIVRFEDYVCPYVGSEACTVCLDCVRADDLVRELVNCKHVFHQECLDRWVDEGQVNCPLCRSILLPSKRLLSSVVSFPIAVANDDPVE